MGKEYRTGDGDILPGLGIFDMITVHPGIGEERCIGNVVAACDLTGDTLVGFENHGGRTYLEGSVRPLAVIREGHGNNGQDGTEGAVYRNALGTYLHGSLLPKNPGLADWLIAAALRHRYGDAAPALAPLDDDLEHAAHAAAQTLGSRRKRRHLGS